MPHYRRKPLELSTDGQPRAPAGNPPDIPTNSPVGGEPTRSPAVGQAHLAYNRSDKDAAHNADVADPAALVEQAARILEEEMAAGALSARTARAPVFALPALGQAGPDGADGLLRDIESLLNNFAAMLTQSGQMPDAAKITSDLYNGDRHTVVSALTGDDTQVPLVRPHYSVRTGEQARLMFRLVNDSPQQVHVILHATDLTTQAGHVIPAGRIAFSPGEVALAPDASADVGVSVDVPLETPPGRYAGQLTAPPLSYLRAVIEVTVV